MMRIPLGKKGEDLACAHLLSHGYTILARNYRVHLGEIDIICKKGPEMVFVEVKTRRTQTYGSPEEAVTPRKQEHVRRVALAYLKQCRLPDQVMRFDVITVLFQGNEPFINHIEAAF